MTNSTIDEDLALRFSIFNTRESYWKWDSYIRYALGQTDIPKGQATYWADALSFFRRYLGEDFLRQTNHHHPLIDLIEGSSSWQVERLIQYAGILAALATDPEPEVFREKLKAPTSAKNEAMDFLFIAQLLRSVSLQVRFPREVLTQKNPDIIIADSSTSENIGAEVSRMEESERRSKIDRDYRLIYSVLRQHLSNPLYSARQLQLTPLLYGSRLKNILVQLQKSVADKNHWMDYEDAYLTIRLYPLSQERAFCEWLEKADRRKGFNGLTLNLDETPRISGYKIREEARHFRQDQAGIIFIPVSSLHFWQQHTAEARKSFQNRLKKYRNIMGIYLYSEMLGADAAYFRFPTDDRFTRAQVNGTLTRYTLFVRNDAFDLPISPDTLEKILLALK